MKEVRLVIANETDHFQISVHASAASVFGFRNNMQVVIASV